MRLATLPLVLLLAGCVGMTAPSSPPPPPASVAVVFDREETRPVIVEGLADLDTGRAVEANDPVRVASISKLVMSLAAHRLVDEGKVDLDADVSRYLGWTVRHPAFPDAPVTLAQLLMHRSGLRDRAGYIVPLGDSLEEKLAEPEAWYPDAPPGEAPFEYANLGSPLVATVLEAASGERYDRLVERTVFAPLGISGCLNWVGCDDAMVGRAVALYRPNGDRARDWIADRPPNCAIPVRPGGDCTLDAYRPGTNASIFSPQGGVRIGMVDLARLGRAILVEDARLLSARGFRSFKRRVPPIEGSAPHFCFYGLGVQTLEPQLEGCLDDLFGDAGRRYGHAGDAYSLRSGLWIDDVSGTGIAYFVTQVPERETVEEGGFAPAERALVRRAMEADGE